MATEMVKSFLSGLRVGEPHICQNLAVVPLLGGHDALPAYQTLEEALTAGTLKITEVGEAGYVPELVVINERANPILMLDGEELVGAKQNRILNLTVLVPALSQLKIAVSCVEQGRWQSISARFSSGHYAPANLRSNMERSVRQSLRSTGEARSDQGQVWSDVQQTLARHRVDSRTMAMADAYAKMATELRESAEAITLPTSACGMAAFVAGQLVVVDLFGYQSTFRQVSRKLIDSYLLAAQGELRGQKTSARKPGQATLRKRTAEALERAVGGQAEERRTIGLGTDVRLSGAGIRGAALATEEAALHVSLFPDDGAGEDAAPRVTTRIASPRRRRAGE